VQLLVDSDEGGDVKAHGTMGAAIRTILVADLVMSVDNVLAVAGAADRAPEGARIPLLIVGLGLSIPLIIVGSTLLMKVMDRFPIIITLGAALLGFLAGEMFVTDPAVAAWFSKNMPEADYIFGGACAALVVVVGAWLQRRGRAEAKAEAEA
jgi:predicted tellurium resistance membrane protein TerC